MAETSPVRHTVGDEIIPEDAAAVLLLLREKAQYVQRVSWWVRWPVEKQDAPGGGGPRDPLDDRFYFSEMYHWPDRHFSLDTESEEILAYIEAVRRQHPQYELYPSFHIGKTKKEP